MDRHHRLREPAAFARLRRQGRTAKHSLVIVSYASNGLKHNRYGFVTSKRLGGAVQRNRVRRRLREATRSLHPYLKGGYDIAVIARGRIVDESYHTIQTALESSFTQASLLNERGSQSP